MIKKMILCLLTLAMLLPVVAHAQIKGFDKVGTTSFQFLKVIPDARMAGMGEASVATQNTAEAVFFNPAGLTSASHLDISLSYLDYFMDVALTSFALAWQMPQIGTIGFQVMVSDLGEIQETRVDHLLRDDVTGIYNPGLTGQTVSPSSQVFGLSYAKDITDKFTFGLTAKYAREDLVEKAMSAFVFDGGVVYKTGFKSMILGTALRNFGTEIQYYDKSYPLPQTFVMGVSGYLLAPEEAFIQNMEDHKLLFAYDMAQSRDHSQQHHLGLEYSLKDFLVLRSGYKINYDEEGLTLGFGLKTKGYRINYAYNDFGEFLDVVHRFTFGFSLK